MRYLSLFLLCCVLSPLTIFAGDDLKPGGEEEDRSPIVTFIQNKDGTYTFRLPDGLDRESPEVKQQLQKELFKILSGEDVEEEEATTPERSTKNTTTRTAARADYGYLWTVASVGAVVALIFWETWLPDLFYGLFLNS